jgi:MoxR-like ATPase
MSDVPTGQPLAGATAGLETPSLDERGIARRISSPATPGVSFTSVEDVATSLGDVGYLATREVASAVFLAGRLGRPILVEGPPGVGKTDLAKAIAQAHGAELVRLQCYEGVDEARALYEWNHAKQILRIASGRSEGWGDTEPDVYSQEFLLVRPLLKAITNEHPTVLLIDELDKADVEMEGLLLELLSDYQVTIPEMGTVAAVQRPFVLITSNAARELSEALRRRCVYLYIEYPDIATELEIVRRHVTDVDLAKARSLVGLVQAMRSMQLRKPPSVAESIDWVATVAGGATRELDPDVLRETLGVALKHRSDVEFVIAELELGDARTDP